jgi:hypothetical protein
MSPMETLLGTPRRGDRPTKLTLAFPSVTESRSDRRRQGVA